MSGKQYAIGNETAVRSLSKSSEPERHLQAKNRMPEGIFRTACKFFPWRELLTADAALTKLGKSSLHHVLEWAGLLLAWGMRPHLENRNDKKTRKRGTG
jgi:hypothetical protein